MAYLGLIYLLVDGDLPVACSPEGKNLYQAQKYLIFIDSRSNPIFIDIP